jgi:hypothetical protein
MGYFGTFLTRIHHHPLAPHNSFHQVKYIPDRVDPVGNPHSWAEAIDQWQFDGP